MNIAARLFIFVIACAWPICSALAASVDATSDRFLKSLLEPETISSFSINPEHYSELTQDEKNAVLSGKAVLGSFFRALQKQQSVVQYLSGDFADRKLNTEALRSKLISEEATVLQIGVSDFSLMRNPDILHIQFFAVMLSEGTFAIGEGEATMNRSNSAWKVSAIKIKK